MSTLLEKYYEGFDEGLKAVWEGALADKEFQDYDRLARVLISIREDVLGDDNDGDTTEKTPETGDISGDADSDIHESKMVAFRGITE